MLWVTTVNKDAEILVLPLPLPQALGESHPSVLSHYLMGVMCSGSV